LVYGKTVFRDFRTSEQPGLGESLGEASSANTAFGLSKLLPMTNRNHLGVEGWLPRPSGAWPYEALKRGLPRPSAKRRKNWGWAKGKPGLESSKGIMVI